MPTNRKEVSPATSDSTAIILNRREVVERCANGLHAVSDRLQSIAGNRNQIFGRSLSPTSCGSGGD